MPELLLIIISEKCVRCFRSVVFEQLLLLLFWFLSFHRLLYLSPLIYHKSLIQVFLTYCTCCASDSGLSNVFVIALNIYCLCFACMSQSPSSAITILSPILTRRRARDKLDSVATCDGHCKNKSTLTDTSANFTDQPHPLSLPSVQRTSLVTFQATQHFPETTSPHFTFEFPSLSHKLSASDHESSPDPSQPFLIT